jgi:hypothetical protein
MYTTLVWAGFIIQCINSTIYQVNEKQAQLFIPHRHISVSLAIFHGEHSMVLDNNWEKFSLT